MIWIFAHAAAPGGLAGPARMSRVDRVERPGGVLDRLAASGREWLPGPGRRVDVADEPGGDVYLGAVDDLEEFGRAYADHEPDVVRVCRRLLGSDEEAKDAPQEVFLRATRSLATYDRTRPLRPWLIAIAGNHCIDRLRRQATEKRVFVDLDPDDEEVSDLPDSALGRSPLGRLVALEEREAVGRAVAALPLKYRIPLALRYFSDLDYAEIGEAIGVSKAQVGTLLFRAKRKLRHALDEGRDPRGRR